MLLVRRCAPLPEEGLDEPKGLGGRASDRHKAEKETPPRLTLGRGSRARSSPESPCHRPCPSIPKEVVEDGTHALRSFMGQGSSQWVSEIKGIPQVHTDKEGGGREWGDGRVFSLTQGPGVKYPER